MALKTKRKTKDQVQAAGIAAIKQRLLDLLNGAVGGYDFDPNEETPWAMGNEEYSRYVSAVINTWHLDRNASEDDHVPLSWLVNHRHFADFDDIDEIARLLYVNGYRA